MAIDVTIRARVPLTSRNFAAEKKSGTTSASGG